MACMCDISCGLGFGFLFPLVNNYFKCIFFIGVLLLAIYHFITQGILVFIITNTIIIVITIIIIIIIIIIAITVLNLLSP